MYLHFTFSNNKMINLYHRLLKGLYFNTGSLVCNTWKTKRSDNIKWTVTHGCRHVIYFHSCEILLKLTLYRFLYRLITNTLNMEYMKVEEPDEKPVVKGAM